jgi:hypothetical protein
MDVHVPRPIVLGLRLPGVDVLTAQEDGSDQYPDVQILDRAGELERVLVSGDKHLLFEAARRQKASVEMAGVIFIHFAGISIGRCVESLSVYASAGDIEDFANRVVYLR